MCGSVGMSRIPEGAIDDLIAPWDGGADRPAAASRGGLMGNNKGRRRRFGAVRQLPSGRYQARYPGPDGLMRTAPADVRTRRRTRNVWLTVTEAQFIKDDWLDPEVGQGAVGGVP